MSKAFKGTINVDIRDSVPDWAPFKPPKAGPVALLRGPQGRRGARQEPAGVLRAGRRGTVRGPRQQRRRHRRLPGGAPVPVHRRSIKRVVIDVSGTPYVDLERQAAAMLARE